MHTSLNAPLLKELSNHYLDTDDGTALQIANSIQEILAEKETTDVIEESVPLQYSLYFQFPLALAILSLGIALSSLNIFLISWATDFFSPAYTPNEITKNVM